LFFNDYYVMAPMMDGDEPEYENDEAETGIGDNAGGGFPEL
jgi:hypothetical protein